MKPFKFNYLLLPLSFLFCVLLFKNISYPLLWNDESETVMTAKNILKFGYPKMHDDKNFIFLPDIGPKGPSWIGYKQSSDANISMPWGHYYFAAIGVFFADMVDDLFLKGAIIRISFSLMGLIGLGIFLFALRDYFPDRTLYQWIIAAFIFIELFSVSLFLHMREARYYSLVIFIVACFFYVFIRHFMLNRYLLKKYMLWMTVVLFVAYQINVVTFLTCCLVMCAYEGIFRLLDILALMKNKHWVFAELWRLIKAGFINLSPVLICGVLIIPFVIYLETFSTAARAAEFYNYTFDTYLEHIKRIYYVFSTEEFLYLALAVKAIQVIVWWRKNNEQKGKKKKDPAYLSIEKLSFFMTLFFVCYCIMISRMPFPIVWTRYIIVLQPIMIIILLLDSVTIFKYIASSGNLKSKNFLKYAFAALLVVGFVMNVQGKRITYIKDYVYQITHQYKGPLDFLIPYIKENFKKPEDVVLATNYEELSYIYYLNCKVILGYSNKNLEEDMKLQPDAIIFRKTWGHNPAPYNQLIQRAKYTRVAFPVYDSNVNNIAEMDFGIQHQFKTKMPSTEQEKSDILIKVK